MPPDNLVDQIHYDICHGKLEGPEIRLTAEQMELAPYINGPLYDGRMLLGKTIRLTDGEPDCKFPPDVPNDEDWVVGGIRFKPRGKA